MKEKDGQQSQFRMITSSFIRLHLNNLSTSTVGNLLNRTILRSVDVHAIRVVIHRHHIPLLDDSVLLGKIRLREGLDEQTCQRSLSIWM